MPPADPGDTAVGNDMHRFLAGLRLPILHLSIAMSGLVGPIPGIASDRPLVFGVHPYLPASELVERFSPLVETLRRETGVPFRLRIGTSYQDHQDAIGRGDVDIAFVGPSVYVKLVERYGHWPAAARLSFSGETRFRGAMVTREGSGIEALRELRGKRFAFGDPNSTLSALVPKALLAKAGVELEDLGGYRYLHNHHNVALAVLLGRYDAGGIKDEIFRQYAHRGLRLIEYTPWISSHLFVLNPRLPEPVQHRVRRILYRLHEQPDGKGILDAIKQGTTALVPVEDRDYDSLRELLGMERPKRN